MLKTLLKKELRQIWVQSFLRSGSVKKGGKKRSGKTMAVVWGILIVYLIVIFTGLAWFLGIHTGLFELGLGWMYYLLLGGAALLFGVLGSVFTTYATLYLAKDNDLLLSLPIPLRDVILSRMLGVYLMGLFYSGAIALPGFVVGLIAGGFSLGRLIGGLIWILVITLIVLGLSCLLGWGVARISLRLKNKSFVIVLLSLAFMTIYYVVYFRIARNFSSMIGAIIQKADSIRASAKAVYLFGRIGEGDWLAMLAWIAGVALFLAVIWLLLRKSFLRIATSSASGKRTAYREGETRQGSVASALLRKEWRRFTGSAAYMLNCGLGVIFLLALGGFLLVRGGTLLAGLENPEMQAAISESVLLRRVVDSLPVMVGAACCTLFCMVDITAPSVSLEGRTIWQIQCLPVSSWQVLRAKLSLHLAVGAVPALFCAVTAAVVVPATPVQKLLIVALAMLFMLLIALLGLALGLRMANLDWTNEYQPIKQSAPVAITIFAGMGLGLALAGLYLWFGWRIGATGWLGAAVLLLLAADAALFLWLRGPGAKRFEELS